MSTQTPPPNDKKPQAAAGKGLLPPEPKFWQRYSRHQELPLSGVGSFTLHFLGIGFLVLMAIGIIRFGGGEKLPVETVELGGGGGNPNGEGDGPGVGETTGGPKEDVNEQQPRTSTRDAKTLELDAGKTAALETKLDDENSRPVKIGEESKDVIAKLGQEAKNKMRMGPPAGKGRGGSGKDGGKDGGEGPGLGDRKGPGNSTGALNQREKRMFRWSMTFKTGFNGIEYVNQLAALGAMLAIPTGPGDSPPGYYVIRDLKHRHGKLNAEDLGSINLISWYDKKPDSVRSLLRALGVNLDVSHIIAFMPVKMEEHLAKLERDYRNLPEDEIFETQFEVVRKPNGAYEPRVVAQTPK